MRFIFAASLQASLEGLPEDPSMQDDGLFGGGDGERQAFAVTTFRITRAQWAWLRQQALERATARGFGKADASEILRELLDRHI